MYGVDIYYIKWVNNFLYYINIQMENVKVPI